MAFAKSRARLYVEDDVKVSFSDVAGVDEAEAELYEVVDFLKNPGKYTSPAAIFSKGCCWSVRQAPAMGADVHRATRAVLRGERLVRHPLCTIQTSGYPSRQW